MCGSLALPAPGAIRLCSAPGSLSLALELSQSWSSHTLEFSLPWYRTHCITLASSLVLDALVRAPDGAHGPSVVESSVGAIPENGTKLGSVTVTYVPLGRGHPAPPILSPPVPVYSDGYPVLLSGREGIR